MMEDNQEKIVDQNQEALDEVRKHPLFNISKLIWIIVIIMIVVILEGLFLIITKDQLTKSSQLPKTPTSDITITPTATKDATTSSYAIVDTGQTSCYNNTKEVSCPADGLDFALQDAHIQHNMPSYTDNEDGTITDNVTGLMWQQDPGNKKTIGEARTEIDSFNLANYDDWRIPTIKELYSLIDFRGIDPSGYAGTDTSSLTPFINTTFFHFVYGNIDAGERIIDSQFGSNTEYVSGTGSHNEPTLFGVNFADGRIKGYGLDHGNSEKTFFFLYVRGNTDYGTNDFVDGNGTIIDSSTGLEWQKSDSLGPLKWKEALLHCEILTIDEKSDWRLPNIKELHSIVDYSRAPDMTDSAAIDSLFFTSPITNEVLNSDYPAFWSSTTHQNTQNGNFAAYISFGRAMGYMNSNWVDVHGAGAQRSDPKIGDASEYVTGHGPQGDAVRIENYVRCVRGTSNTISGIDVDVSSFPNKIVTNGNLNQALDPTPTVEAQPSAPAEATAACMGKNDYDVCTFLKPDNTMFEGECFTLGDGKTACYPAGIQ